MSHQLVINELGKKSPELALELRSVKMYSTIDPEVSVAKARKTLEYIVSERTKLSNYSLADKITSLSAELPESVIAYMHFIRKLGNSAVHGEEQISQDVAVDVLNLLINLSCWHLKVDCNQQKQRARFFIAEPIHKTWAKIAVLTEDGELYSEYLTYNQPTTFVKKNFSYNSFKASDFKFGQKEHGRGYQPIKEVSYKEAISYQLRSQSNWVERYVTDKGISIA
ncbi:DUF4145 domain-containing protein [Photobacterium sanguinicancri]|uniref:DUF4145 domain-containing protein n=1 Tax=Photobacterium sanguinicancri TaxID=875932 RepID=UPI003D0AE21C